MNEALERLQSIGAQKIYEKTHIPVEHVQALLHESFDSFSKVQFMGFISILQREYQIDLTELRNKGLENFQAQKKRPEGEGVFIASKKKTNGTLVYIMLVLLVFLGVAYFKMNSKNEVSAIPEMDSTLIMDVQKNIELAVENESNSSSIETNSSQEDLNATVFAQEEFQEEQEGEKSLKFTAKTKLWLGYIDAQTNKRYDKIFTGGFELDAKKKWLLVFGHNFVDIEINGELVTLSAKGSLRFLYEDEKLQSLTLTEFKKLNRGRAW